MATTQELHYAPDIAAKAVIELTNAMRSYSDMEYAKALLSEPRMVSNIGLMASCGLTTREVKRAKECMSDGLPTMEAQKRAIQYLDALDREQEVSNGA
jgi:hypothetical protein